MFSKPGNLVSLQNISPILHVDDITEDLALEMNLGRKGLSLYKLHTFDVPIPEFFVISPSVFSDFVKKILSEKGDELLKVKNPEPRDILNIFHRYDFDPEINQQLLKEYTKLSGFSDAWVSVRSTVAAPMHKEISFTGVFATELNIRGFNNLLKSIKSVYASMFTDSAVMYAVREGVELADVKLAVVVQKMVHAEVSGTCFTLDPVTLSTDKMSVEAVFGLGDVIANGEISPDTYQLNKKDLQVFEKHISPQEWMKVRALNSGNGGYEKISISPSWSHRQKLDDKYIVEVSKICLLIEDKLGENVDVEWVLSGGRVYVLQYKPAYTKQSYLSHHVQFGGYGYVANTVGQLISELMGRKDQATEMIENSMHEAAMLVAKEAPVEQEVVKPVVEQTPAVQSITSGIGVSFGKAKGSIHVLKALTDEFPKDSILLVDEFNDIFSALILKSSGVISAKGSLTSTLAILCREFGIPAVVGVQNAMELLKANDVVEIDGNSGSIYMIDEAKVEAIQVAKEIVQKKQEFVTAVPESKMEKLSDEPLAFTATKVFVDGAGIDQKDKSNGVVYVDLDRIMIQFGKHPSEVLDAGNYKAYAQEIVAPVVKIAQESGTNEVVVVIGAGTSNDFKKVAKKDDSEVGENGSKGVARYLNNKKALLVAIRLIRRIRNVYGCRNVTLGVYAPQNGTLMKEIKKEISAGGLRRGSSFSIYAVVDNPAEVILADDILDAEIDGMIVQTPMLARYVFNLPISAKDVVYDLGAGSLLRILDSISSSVKAKGKKLIIMCEDNKEILKYSVNKGVYGVVVNGEYISSARKIVAEQEAKVILSIK